MIHPGERRPDENPGRRLLLKEGRGAVRRIKEGVKTGRLYYPRKKVQILFRIASYVCTKLLKEKIV
jgi:hypothetical protein